MRTYLAVTATLFALLALAHFYRVIAEWHGIDGGFFSVAGAGVVSTMLSVWGWLLFADARRPN
jgi:hypothetical protein